MEEKWAHAEADKVALNGRKYDTAVCISGPAPHRSALHQRALRCGHLETHPMRIETITEAGGNAVCACCRYGGAWYVVAR